jgi:cation:H+ antiporter
LALDNVTGGNIVNVTLVLGLPLLIAGLTATFLFDGCVSRGEAVVVFLLFLAWLVTTAFEARRRRDPTAAVLDSEAPRVASWRFGGGLVLLFAAGQLIVADAFGVAEVLGLDLYLVGALAVAIGTSAPEIAMAAAAQIHRHGEITLGVILGSNIFNGLFIVPVATAIHPIPAAFKETAIGLGFGAVVVAFTYPGPKGVMTRRRGVVLILPWVAFVLAQTQARGTI